MCMELCTISVDRICVEHVSGFAGVILEERSADCMNVKRRNDFYSLNNLLKNGQKGRKCGKNTGIYSP